MRCAYVYLRYCVYVEVIVHSHINLAFLCQGFTFQSRSALTSVFSSDNSSGLFKAQKYQVTQNTLFMTDEAPGYDMKGYK